jgi:hypothetical protein
MAFEQFLYKFSLLISAITLIVSSMDVATRQHTQHNKKKKKKKKGRHSSSPNHQRFSKPLHQGTEAFSCFRIEVFSTSSKGRCRRIISEIQTCDRRKRRSIHTQFWRRQDNIRYEKTPTAEKTVQQEQNGYWEKKFLRKKIWRQTQGEAPKPLRHLQKDHRREL